jgi:predicted glycoside hydrolase/deacetylase ChbG (UPF0249 family)
MPAVFTIVNADDFGASSQINRAIVRAFAEGLISSTSIMANMPGFSEACALAHQHGFVRRIGLHLNLTAGEPMTTGIAACPRFCDARGRWLPRRRIFRVTTTEASALEAEIAAQITSCERLGIHLGHLDSHHHMHVQYGLARIVIRSAQRNGIRAVRLAFTRDTDKAHAPGLHNVLAKAYHFVHNRRLRLQGLARSDYFGDVRDAGNILLRTTTGVVEVR